MSPGEPGRPRTRSEARPVPDRGAIDRLLWLGALAGPVVFLADLLVRYALVEPECAARDKLALHLSTLGALVLAVVPMALAWWSWRRLEAGEGEERVGEEPPDAAAWRPRALGRGHLLAMATLGLGALSTLAILALELPGVMLKVCQ